jgi:hypothetical protein
MALCNGQTEWNCMLNARYRFAVLWQRLVAALSLVMAAALAPGAVTAPAGAGAVGSRVGSGAAVASAAGALASNVAAVIEGGQQQPVPRDTSSTDGTKAKACTVSVWQGVAPFRPEAGDPPATARAAPPTHAARSGDARAPPAG